jgi:hypothetical protein
MFSNWLIATIIISYTNYRKQEKNEKEASKTIMISLVQEYEIVGKKIYRSLMLFINRTFKKIKQTVSINNLKNLKKNPSDNNNVNNKKKNFITEENSNSEIMNED